MEVFWRVVYNVVIMPFFIIAARFYSLFDAKARTGVKDRKGMFEQLSRDVEKLHQNGKPVIWFHCSSVGELEQAKPIIAKIKHETSIVVSFFSPSWYESGIKYKDADVICYIPFDTAGNARRMFQLIKPSLLVFIRFDVWPNHVWTAVKMNVPVVVADAGLHAESTRLRPVIRSFLKSVHKHIDIHCAISGSDAERLKRLCQEDADIRVMGDTRFDQVIARKNSAGKKLEGLLPDFHVPVIIAGSTYTEDEQVVLDSYENILKKWGKVQLILVPHEPEPHRLNEIHEMMKQRDLDYILLSQVNRDSGLENKAVVVDCVGVLAELYMLGDITFIGGSFHGKIHNVMEPAIMGKPVLFGPTIQNSLEALMLRETGSGIMVENSQQMTEELIKLLDDKNMLDNLGKKARALIESNAGATEKIVDCIRNLVINS
ncbi:hypothetical protein GF312_17400 [Candidatus Poribacteria bacterium]|nr:hypothetical protein [Candidatus Poribacteria bacterium]